MKLINSKTFWFNVLSTLLEIAAVTDGLMPAKYLVYTSTAKAILNIILRRITAKPIISIL